MKKLIHRSRRRFLKQLAVASVGSSMLATQGKLSLMQSALAAGGTYANLTDHKSLVCIYLFGGNDAFNMFVPNDNTGYQQYADVRGPLALNQNQLHATNDGQYGFHPSMPNVADLYNSGRLAVLANAGTLIEPTDRDGVIAGSAVLPPDLFSHSHQTEMWQTNKPPVTGITQNGWGGEMADLLNQANANPTVPPTFTLAGQNNWQAGQLTQQMAMNSNNGAENFEYLSGNSYPPNEQSRTQAWANMHARDYNNRFRNEVAHLFGSAREQITVVEDALAQAAAINTTYPGGNSLAAQLRIVAQMISVREYLGMKRQMFFVGVGDYDSHGNQLGNHAANLALLDAAMNSFNNNMNELGLQNSVTTFTMSEFGRTLTVNGDGTDHAWGTHCMMMGGAVAGGQIYGQMPTLEIAGPDDVFDTGRLIPTTSVDQYAATLGAWMNLTNSDLNQLFPNLSNFSTPNLGFLS